MLAPKGLCGYHYWHTQRHRYKALLGIRKTKQGNSVSQSPFVTLSTSENGKCVYKRIGSIVCVMVTLMSTGSEQTASLGYLPTECRPPQTVIGYGYIQGTSVVGQTRVDSDGEVTIWCSQANCGAYFSGSVVFPVA